MTSPRACIVSVSGPDLTPDEAAFLREANPWGVILMGRSCLARTQVRALVDAVWAATGRPTLMFIDQEGGRVRRLRPPEWPAFPAADLYGRLHEADPQNAVEAAWLHHRLIAAELAPMGLHADCAPVLDLHFAGAHAVTGDRAFASDPQVVSQLARAALDGLAAGGVAGVVKHMPGHGRALVDSHHDTPKVEATAEELERFDLRPFRDLQDAPMGMTAHVVYTAFDAAAPATLSPAVIADVIRGRIGFQGLLMTDDLGMDALGGALSVRVQRAIAAGCDIALHCAGFVKDPAEILRQMQETAFAAPELAGPSLKRAEAAERAAMSPRPFDAEAGWAEFRTRVAGAETLTA